MKKYIFIFLFALPSFALAQYVPGDQKADTVQAPQKNKDKPKDNIPDNRYLFGGNIGLAFGNETLIDLSPQMGYFFNRRLLAGFGITYIYYGIPQLNFKTNVYGGQVFGRYYFVPSLYAQAGYEVLNRAISSNDNRINIGSPLAGLGASIQVGDNAYMLITGLWNFNQTALSPYSNPIIRMGFVVGL